MKTMNYSNDVGVLGLEPDTSTIGDLNVAWPQGDEPVSQGDDHIRLIKNALKNTFPNFDTGAVQATRTAIDFTTSEVFEDPNEAGSVVIGSAATVNTRTAGNHTVDGELSVGGAATLDTIATTGAIVSEGDIVAFSGVDPASVAIKQYVGDERATAYKAVALLIEVVENLEARINVLENK